MRLCDSRSRCNCSRHSRLGSRCDTIAVDFSLWAFARDVASLAAAVAGLSGSVQGSSVRRGAVASEMVRSSTLVAGRGACAGVASTESAIAAARATASSNRAASVGAGALLYVSILILSQVRLLSYRKVTRLSARIAASAGGSAAQAQGRAVGLDVSKALAVVALLRLRGARVRAAIGLVAWPS